MPSNLTGYDGELAEDVTFQFRSKSFGGFNIKFQFPPRIVADNRRGEWVEGPIRGDEPVAVYATSGAREITMIWTYITGAKGFGNRYLFTPYMISSQIQALRSYFASPYDDMPIEQALILRYRMWYHTGHEIFTCRMKSVDVSYGRALVTDKTAFGSHGSGNPETRGDEERRRMGGLANQDHPRRTYALRTDVTVELRLWTQVASSGDDLITTHLPRFVPGKEEEGAVVSSSAKIALARLAPIVPADWQ